MSLVEILHRVQGYVKKKHDQYYMTNFLPTGVISTYPNPILFLPELQSDIQIKDYSIFGAPLEIDKPINWHLDFINKKEFPKKISFSIDTRTGKHGNAKVVWEVNRLQFLPLICIKYHQSKDIAHLEQFQEIIKSWIEANPYLMGVNWYSNIEVNIRIINWFFCWEILQVNQLINENKKFREFVEQIWLPLIELHAIHSFKYPSKFSSANNHLIAEASGWFIAGSYWSFKQSSKWRKKGRQVLEHEIQKQHSKDGINREQASEYIQFITDFFLISFVVAERSGAPFSNSYKLTLKKILFFIYYLMDLNGNVPYYGDDDDGKVVSLSFESHNNFQSLLTSGTVLFGDPRFKSRAEGFDLKNQLLFGKKGEEKFESIPTPRSTSESKIYLEEGHFIVKKGKGQFETYLHVDMAPLGYLSIAAHGHADALSFFLNVDGMPFIIDTGTYTYHSKPEWRQYFKGTLAHNTIRVDGLDQAKYGGPSLWLDHFKVKISEVVELDDCVKIKGGHNGYESIGVEHIRCYTYDKVRDIITIDDEIIASNDTLHNYEIPMHLHPDIKLKQLTSNEFKLSYPGKRDVIILVDKKLNTTIVNGAKSPLLGWYSPSFLQKQPTSVIYAILSSNTSFKLQTVIKINPNNYPSNEV